MPKSCHVGIEFLVRSSLVSTARSQFHLQRLHVIGRRVRLPVEDFRMTTRGTFPLGGLRQARRAKNAGRAKNAAVGDGLLCTSAVRVSRAASVRAATGLLLKVNQVGTLTEAAEAMRAARAAGWQVTVSARSGETEDDWLADLSVGWGGDQIKVGSMTHSERLAKYNRLLIIEAEVGLPVVTWPGEG
jgi:Enolase, C-terminal TIM barrel domain